MEGSPDSRQQDTRYRILHLLKVSGPQTVKDLAAALGISSMGVRQHLVFLEGAGWIRHRQTQRGLGRPEFVYALTKRGDEQHFPRAYGPQMIGLLSAVRELDGSDGLDRIFEKRTEQLAAEYRERIKSDDLEERVRALADIRSEEGFMAGWKRESKDMFRLWEHNCAIFEVARSCNQACTCEHELFCQVLEGADVARESHILSGDPRCTYVIRRKR